MTVLRNNTDRGSTRIWTQPTCLGANESFKPQNIAMSQVVKKFSPHSSLAECRDFFLMTKVQDNGIL